MIKYGEFKMQELVNNEYTIVELSNVLQLKYLEDICEYVIGDFLENGSVSCQINEDDWFEIYFNVISMREDDVEESRIEITRIEVM